MKLFRRKNDLLQNPQVRLLREPYLIINIVFAGVILLIFLYSGFFSPDKDNYPVTCIHEKITGEPCVSCGLSHSFSLIVRARIEEAYKWNPYGMRIFLFFALQLLMRVSFSFYFLRYPDTRKQLIIVDCLGSGIIFFIAFWPFMASIFRGTFYV
jgi:Protein of unknown function (DUF2752)